MPPRPVSRCSRLLSRQLATPVDNNLWVSEALLASVFERYFAVSHVPRRRASSTPGPLESRRRLGKRRMGDLNAGYAPSGLPDWASPEALDLSNWKWEPPTLASVREAQRQAQLQLAQHWLGKHLVPPSVREQSQTLEPPPPPTLLESLEQFQSRIDAEPLPDLRQACDDICLQFRETTLTDADRLPLVELLGGIFKVVNERFGGSLDGICLYAPLYSAVVERLSSTINKTHSAAAAELNQRLLTYLLEMPAGDHLCSLFELTMRRIPAQSDSAVLQVESILDKFLLLWNETALNTGICRVQIQRIASALSHFGVRKPLAYRAAEQRLLELSGTAEQQHRLRYAWLSVLAQSRMKNATGLLKSFSVLFADQAVAANLSSMDICKVLLQHWSSTRVIPKSVRTWEFPTAPLSRENATDIATLAEVLYTKDPTWEPRLLELCRALRAMGRLDELRRSFYESTRHHTVSQRLLRKVAVACDDYRVALSLYSLSLKLNKKKQRNEWSKDIWDRYLDQAVSDPSAHIDNVWKLLRLCNPSDKTATIAARLAREHASSGNLSSRAALRRVEEYIAVLQSRGQALPPKALNAVYSAVTKDLTEKEWGRTSRLVWFINLVDRECGPEKATEVRNMLRSWRELVTRVRTREGLAAEGGGEKAEEER